MSSLNFRGLVRLAVAASLTLGLAACFRPLYGPTASGEPLPAVLASIEVEPVSVIPAYERLSHYLRSELVFDLDGSGLPSPKRYKLAMTYSQKVQTPLVDTTTGRAQSATVIGEVNYTLRTIEGEKVVTSGTATGYVTYDRSPQRFATVRAARDADIRLARSIAEQIKTRLAATLATAS
jgi:LPS-assembly lipoprotein